MMEWNEVGRILMMNELKDFKKWLVVKMYNTCTCTWLHTTIKTWQCREDMY